MREIKFRAWDRKRKIMIGSDYPDNWDDDVDSKDEWWEDVDMMCLTGIEDAVDNENLFIMQYIGLTDCSDKKIYEGDIVKCFLNCDGQDILMDEYNNGPKGIVLIFWDYAGFCAEVIKKPKGYLANYIDLVDCTTLRVLGNVFENPELLKKKPYEFEGFSMKGGGDIKTYSD